MIDWILNFEFILLLNKLLSPCCVVFANNPYLRGLGCQFDPFSYYVVPGVFLVKQWVKNVVFLVDRDVFIINGTCTDQNVLTQCVIYLNWRFLMSDSFSSNFDFHRFGFLRRANIISELNWRLYSFLVIFTWQYNVVLHFVRYFSAMLIQIHLAIWTFVYNCVDFW